MNLDTHVAQGNTAKVFLHEDQIIKVFHDYFPQEEAVNEAAKQEAARNIGLPVPQVIDVTNIDGHPAIVMEYVKGGTLGDLLMENMDNASYYMNISVDIQLEIHDVHLSTIEPMPTKLKRQIQSTQKLSVDQKVKLIEKLDQMPKGNSLCHGDFHLFNLIMSDDKAYIIDWVDSSIGDIRADVYRSYLLYLKHSTELAELYLNLYCNKSGLSKEEIVAWAPIIAGAKLSENVQSENEDRLLKIVQDC